MAVNNLWKLAAYLVFSFLICEATLDDSPLALSSSDIDSYGGESTASSQPALVCGRYFAIEGFEPMQVSGIYLRGGIIYHMTGLNEGDLSQPEDDQFSSSSNEDNELSGIGFETLGSAVSSSKNVAGEELAEETEGFPVAYSAFFVNNMADSRFNALLQIRDSILRQNTENKDSVLHPDFVFDDFGIDAIFNSIEENPSHGSAIVMFGYLVALVVLSIPLIFFAVIFFWNCGVQSSYETLHVEVPGSKAPLLEALADEKTDGNSSDDDVNVVAYVPPPTTVTVEV